ncbi:MAG: 2'-5' RNA ligase family protein [Candidatus Limnocylindrales bacterium]|nr:2'-5' RNA ligase family protein [Candidatus Limnocylindrales bacterium]
MPTTEPISGVVVRVILPGALGRARRRHDVAAASGVPAHVTLLFPFLPVAQLEPHVRWELAEIAGGIAPFEVRFADVGRFPGVVYLRPEPAAPFARLTASIVAQFPDYPPYGGAYLEVVPHLTLAESGEAPLDAIAVAAKRSLPFTRHVSAIDLLTEDGAGRWHRHWRIPLGVRP